jgi:hypothetical protein
MGVLVAFWFGQRPKNFYANLLGVGITIEEESLFLFFFLKTNACPNQLGRPNRGSGGWKGGELTLELEIYALSKHCF